MDNINNSIGAENIFWFILTQSISISGEVLRGDRITNTAYKVQFIIFYFYCIVSEMRAEMV